VWLSSGKRVDLSREPTLWRVLDVLASSGGAASKERIAAEVWDVREYHPLRHDQRLQTAVRRLRVAIEDDASQPARLVTTDDGYRFGTSAPLRRLR
jgi:hypothetical protein